MEKAEMSALDAYLNRVYKIIILMAPIAAMMSAICFSIFKAVGWYASVPMAALVVFDITNVIYTSTAIWLFRTCIGEDGLLKREKLRNGKIFISAVILIQWNFISYMVPAREWWAFAFFFIVLAVFFFDMKMMTVVSGGILVSTVLSWFIKGRYLFVEKGKYFYPDVILRVICITLTIATLLGLTYFGGKFLVEELEKYVNYDTLTHLLNRRSMDNYLQAAYRQANTGKATFCLMMMDIDDFKKVNDTYGHDCGDEVLRSVANTVSCGVKKNDNVFRWGGEEILILLNTDEEKAVAAAERIRKDIAKDPINYRGNIEVSVTVTIGVSAYKNGSSIQDLMDDADAKLYYGKRHGKNQVVNVLPDNDSDHHGKEKRKQEKTSEKTAGMAFGSLFRERISQPV